MERKGRHMEVIMICALQKAGMETSPASGRISHGVSRQHVLFFFPFANQLLTKTDVGHTADWHAAALAAPHPYRQVAGRRIVSVLSVSGAKREGAA